MSKLKSSIMEYGLHIVDEYSTYDFKIKDSMNPIFKKYEDILSGNQNNEKNLSWILSKVTLNKKISRNKEFLIPGRLRQNIETLAFVESEVQKPAILDKDLFQDLNIFSKNQEFVKFYHGILKFAWSLPCKLGVHGVSLFDQWKTVAALIFATGDKWEKGPSETFSMIGGDIPGIQEFVYTITSKGAAKGLRGRSYFIQLLSDAIIRRLLNEWKLEETNIIYNAGGNFMILAPVDINQQPLKKEFEEIILDYFHGDLGLCLEKQDIKSFELVNNQFSEKTRSLKEKIAKQKRERFSIFVQENWEHIFAPQGKPGNQYCVICQTPLGRDEGIPLNRDLEETDEKKCEVCDTFENLANVLKDAKYESISLEHTADLELWQEILYKISGNVYRYEQEINYSVEDSIILSINQPDFDSTKVNGFKFIANATPKVSTIDIEQCENEDNRNGMKPKIGDIRTFSQMASASTGIKRMGILRMDVDNLGKVMILGLDKRNILSISCLSRLLDWFFKGRLNRICEEINKKQVNQLPENGEKSTSELGDRLYTIYAGGDDLFIVGSWDLMPELANKIQEEFKKYSCHNPSLSISAGIVLEPDKYPLYQAANDAGVAEDFSKKFISKDGVEKNAFTFIGQTFPWANFDTIWKAKNDIVEISYEENKSIIQIVQNVYQQYLSSTEKETPIGNPHQVLSLGSWQWRSVYALTRLDLRISSDKEEIKNKVRTIRENILKQPDIYGLAARWAELVIRKDENDGK